MLRTYRLKGEALTDEEGTRYTNTFLSSEARAQKVAALAKGLLDRCPKLEDFSVWNLDDDGYKLGSELEAFLSHVFHPSEPPSP
jgi:hypothetical protein